MASEIEAPKTAVPLGGLEAGLPKGLRSSLTWLILGALAAWLVSLLPLDLAPIGKTTLSVFVFTLALWIGEVVPTGIATIVWAGLLVLTLGKAMPSTTIFSGFTVDTIWLMIGALLIGQATSETGLAKRIAYTLMSRGKTTYRRAILYLWVTMFVMDVVVPSETVRMAIFIPIMYSLGAAFNVTRNRSLAANLFLNVYWSSAATSPMWYTGSATNIVALGVLQQLTGYHQTWIGWLIAQIVPVAIFAVGSYLIINYLFRPRGVDVDSPGSADAVKAELSTLGATTAPEWRAGAFFAVAVILWALEPIIHMPNAWTAAFVAAALFVPGLGVLDEKSIGRISWNTVLLLGIALGIGNVMAYAKVDAFFLQHLLNPIFAPLAGTGSAGLAFGIGVFSMIFHLIIPSGIVQTSVLSPLLIKFAMVAGFDPRVAAFVIPRAAVLFFLPYQSLPMMVLWGTGYLTVRRCLQSMGVMVLFMLIWMTVTAPYLGWISHALNF